MVNSEQGNFYNDNVNPIESASVDNEDNYGEELLDSVDSHTYKIGEKALTTKELFTGIRTKIDLQQQGEIDPEPFVIAAQGNPVRGKTTLLKQGLHYIFSDRSAQQSQAFTGEKPKPLSGAIVYEVTWGDVFYLIDPAIIWNQPYHGDPVATAAKRKELMEYANPMYESLLAFTLQEANRRIELEKQKPEAERDNRPHLVITDNPLQSGIIQDSNTADGEVNTEIIGMPRGYPAIRNMSRREGLFSNVGKYDDYYIGAYATTEVFEAGKKNRQAIQSIDDIRLLVEQLEENGTSIDVDMSDPHAVAELRIVLDKRQSAREEEIDQCEMDAYQLNEELKRGNFLAQKAPLTYEEYRTSKTRFPYENFLSLRWILSEDLKIPPEKLAFAANHQKLPKLNVVSPSIDMEYHRPAWELQDEV